MQDINSKQGNDSVMNAYSYTLLKIILMKVTYKRKTRFRIEFHPRKVSTIHVESV